MTEISMKRFVCVKVKPVHDFGTGGNTKKRGKGKTKGLAGMLAHDFRFIKTPNADKKLIGKNLVFTKKTKWSGLKATHINLRKIGIKNAFSVPRHVEKLLRRLNIKIQKNSDVVTAFMFSVSPEYLRDGNLENEINPEKLEKFTNGTIKFLRKMFGLRLILASLHLDEMNPHISAYIVPLLKKEMIQEGRPRKGEENKPRKIRTEMRLAHSEMFTRDEIKYEKVGEPPVEVVKEVIYGTCSKLQDQYADFLNQEGLEVMRGVRQEPGLPRLEYVTNKELYDRGNRGVLNGEIKVQSTKDLSREEMEDVVRHCMQLAEESKNFERQRDHYQAHASKKDERIAILEKRIDDIVRDYPVEKVIELITGFEPIFRKNDVQPVVRHKSRKDKFININCEFLFPNGQRIGVDQKKNAFKNLTPEIPFLGEGAGRITATGSINAVMFLTGCSFDAALARLHAAYGNDSLARALPKRVEQDVDEKKSALLIPDESKWPELYEKLKALKLRDEVIDQAKKEKTIAANREGQILFSMQTGDGVASDNGPGMILFDPQFPDIPIMEAGEDGLFMLMDYAFNNDGIRMSNDKKDTILCASPMDAMAVKSLEEFRKANVIAIGQNPGKSAKDFIHMMAEQHPGRLHYAQNLLEHGRYLVEWLTEHFKDLIPPLRLPQKCISWIGLNREHMPDLTQIKEIEQQEDLE